ncbi:hypothetical protein HK101_009532 [Irineochytrium annulatum]|nr:hypothetical protein HK101_009532 [Irineochytrium annulatum]
MESESAQYPAADGDDGVPKLPPVWEVLGPFAIGARELGTDPLSAYGGFEAIPFSTTDRYPSELADGGYVGWTTIATNTDQTVGPVLYPNVRWEFNQDPFGWTSLHHATYFRGTFRVARTGIYSIGFDHVVSFKIDNRAFIGNVYGYAHSGRNAVWLDEGDHRVYVCAMMDVRLFGGALPPKVLFTGSFQPVDMSGPSRGVLVFPDDAVVPEVMDGKLVTHYLSVTVMNANVTGQALPPKGVHDGDGEGDGEEGQNEGKEADDADEEQKEGKRREDGTAKVEAAVDVMTSYGEQSESGWVQIMDVIAKSPDNTQMIANISIIFTFKLAPGQVFPLPVELYVDPPDATPPEYVDLDLLVTDLDTDESFTVAAGRYYLDRREWGQEYKITFVDYDGSVQYAMARPPKKGCRTSETRCPVVLALHGAGVEASSPFWTQAYRQQEYSWLLFPTGRTPWGFDWHGPSHENVEQALIALQHLHGVPENLKYELAIDLEKLVYTGHSNGGQGAWWLISHHPDRALAAIPASGYMKIQFYTPYYMRVGDAYADPMFRGIMESSIAENDVDLYAANMAGVPIMARTGGNDDNVPPLNTRRLVRLVNEWNRNPVSVNISEVPGQGHWFEGVVGDDILQEFLDRHLDPNLNPGLPHPKIPEAFTLSTLNPASTGSKGGIRILQLEVPYRLATIRVHQIGTHWILNTTNVRRFGFFSRKNEVKIDTWSIDGTDFAETPKIGPTYLREEGETYWKVATDLLWISEERYSSTYGPAAQILTHSFVIVIPSRPTVIDIAVYRRAAQQLATSWYMFGRGGTRIIRDVDVRDGLAAKYHMMVLGGPRDNKFTARRADEGNAMMVEFTESGGIKIDKRKYEAPGTGIIFLAPSPTRTLMGLFLAGTDELGFLRAVWTVPFRTGLMVPDYMVVGDEYGDPATGWTAGDGSPYGGAGTKGGGGVFAAGYWNNRLVHYI